MMDAATLEVQTLDGRLFGSLSGGVASFVGIRYAAAPVGRLRLRSPQPLAPWTGLRDATVPGPARLQTRGGNQTWMNEPIERQSEDCLFLNVWTPDVRARLPVLFWLHGGATRNGHGVAPGIGLALFAAPIVALVQPDPVPGPMLVLGGAVSLLAALREWRRIDVRLAAIAFAGRVPGSILAGLVISALAALLLIARALRA